jgi:hypothetical protein
VPGSFLISPPQFHFMTIYVMRNATCSTAFVPLLPGNTGDVISGHAELIVNVARDGMAKTLAVLRHAGSEFKAKHE